jgi:peptide/nickel transport system substrate-binding protein
MALRLTRGLVPAALTVLVAAAVAIATPGIALAKSSDQQNSLVVAVSNDPASIDPARNTAEPIGSEMIINIFDTLVAWTAPDFTHLEGRLASAWQMAPDGKSLTLQLRPGVRFQDGTPFDAAAVKFSIERTRDLNPYMEASFGVIDRIDVAGPLQLKITLKQPMPMFLSLLAQPQAAIVSPTAVKKWGAKFGSHPVGTGPFKFRSYTPDTSVILERNPDYFRGPSKLQRVIYRVIPDASTRRLELKYGGIDIGQQAGQLASIPADDIASFKKDGKVRVLQVPSQIIRQIEFNNKDVNSPVHDLRVRQAMAYAVDYDGMINGVFSGLAERVYGPLPTSNWAFNPAMKEKAFTYNPAKARQLLAAAGYKPGQLKFTLYTYQGSIWSSVATFLQANFADVGIAVTVQQTEFPQFRALQTTGKFDIAFDGRQPWYNDPDAHVTIGYLSTLADTAMTFRMPKDDALDKLIVQAQTTVDEVQRKQLYFTLQEQLAARVPAVYLFSNKIIVFIRSNVKGIVVNSAPPLNEYWSVYKDASVPGR